MRLNKDAKIIFSVLLVIVLVILSTASPNIFFKLLFLVFGSAWIILSFCEDMIHDAKRQKLLSRASGAVFAALFVWSVVYAGSFPAYGRELQSFFQAKPSESVSQDEAAAAVYEEAGSGFRQVEEWIQAADAQVSQIAKDLQHYSKVAEEQQFFASKYDPSEVEKIIGVIREKLEEDKKKESPSFADIQTNPHTVELFYKMRLGRELFHYVDLIRALESIGIDCEAMSIDEYKLMTWDTEYMFAVYSMRQSVLPDALQGKTYEEGPKLYYRDFRIKLNEYSDTTDYGNWCKEYESPVSAEDIVQRLDTQFTDAYKKFHMNFQANSN